MNPFEFGRTINKPIPNDPNVDPAKPELRPKAFRIDQCLLQVGANFVEGLIIDKDKLSMRDHYMRIMLLLNQASNRGGKVCNLSLRRYLENNTVLLFDLVSSDMTLKHHHATLNCLVFSDEHVEQLPRRLVTYDTNRWVGWLGGCIRSFYLHFFQAQLELSSPLTPRLPCRLRWLPWPKWRQI